MLEKLSFDKKPSSVGLSRTSVTDDARDEARPSMSATTSRSARRLVLWLGLVAWLRHAAIRGSSACVSPETNDVPSGWFTCVDPKPSSARLVEPLYPPKPTLRTRRRRSFFCLDTHTRSGRVMMTMTMMTRFVRSAGVRSRFSARRRLGRAMEVPSAAASRDPRGLPGDGESRARVESNDAKTSSRRKRRVRRDWTSWLAALTRRTPRRRTRPRRRARRMRPNPVSPYPSPCLAVSVSAPPGGARTSADGAAVKNFFSKAREHRRLPREIGQTGRGWLPH